MPSRGSSCVVAARSWTRWRSGLRVMLAALVLARCAKPAPTSPGDGGAADSRLPENDRDSATRVWPPNPAPPEAVLPPSPPGEAKRSTFLTLEAEPALALVVAPAKAHFAAHARGPFALQTSELALGRTALWLARPDGSDPFLAVVSNDALVWSHDKPTGGIVPPVAYATIAPHSGGGVAMFAFDPATHIVLGRIWDNDGAPFADLKMLETDECGALSAAAWPGRGVLVVASVPGGPRAQLLTDDAALAFGLGGVAAGPAWRSLGPVRIVVDSHEAVWLVMHGASKGSGDRIIVQRLDATGRSLWADPVGIDVARVAVPSSPIEASLVREGVVRVALPEGSWGRAVEVDASGHVVRVSK